MKLVIYVLFNFLAFIFSTVIEIEFMTRCVTNHDAWIYNGYGCYCGIGGSGETVDGIDECCAAHDACYGNLHNNKTCWQVPLEYLPVYTWKCVGNSIECTGLDTFGYQIIPHDCGARLCECDRELVDCWAMFPEPTVQKKCSHPNVLHLRNNN